MTRIKSQWQKLMEGLHQQLLWLPPQHYYWRGHCGQCIVAGTARCQHPGLLLGRLRRYGYRHIKICPWGPWGKISEEQVLRLIQQLNCALKAHLPPEEAWLSLRCQRQRAKMNHLVTLSVESLRTRGKMMPVLCDHLRPSYHYLLTTAEAQHVLSATIDILIGFHQFITEKQRDLKQQLRYPLMILIAMVGCFLFFCSTILPKMLALISMLHGHPSPILLGLQQHYLMLTALSLICCLTVALIIQQAIKQQHPWLLNIPYCGTLIIQFTMARDLHWLNLLLQTHHTLAEALGHLASSKTPHQTLWYHMQQKLHHGLPLTQITSDTLSDDMLYQLHHLFSSKHGHEQIASTAQNLMDKAQHSIHTLTQCCQPLCLLVIGGALCFFFLLTYQPLLSCLTSLS